MIWSGVTVKKLRLLFALQVINIELLSLIGWLWYSGRNQPVETIWGKRGCHEQEIRHCTGNFLKWLLLIYTIGCVALHTYSYPFYFFPFCKVTNKILIYKTLHEINLPQLNFKVISPPKKKQPLYGGRNLINRLECTSIMLWSCSSLAASETKVYSKEWVTTRNLWRNGQTRGPW